MDQGNQPRLTPYERWLKQENVPVIRDYSVRDLTRLPLELWERKGGRGAFLNLIGTGQADDAYVCEIPPGATLKPQRHLYEEMIYILKGRGATTVWVEGGPKQSFEWQEGSLFSPPLNIWHQHFNGQGNEPARYLAVTNAPVMINLFHNEDFIFRNPIVLTDRFDGRENYFSASGKSYPRRIWESNFIPNVREFELQEWKDRGAGGSNINFEMAHNSMAAHVSEFPVGTYKKAHRHGPGAHVVILTGEGYSLLWPEGEEKIKIDWQVGSVVVPPNRWFHQHFNTGKTPARYLALRRGGPARFRPAAQKKATELSVKLGGDQIEYEDEDPAIRKMFEEAVGLHGGVSEMDRFFPR